MELRAVVAGAEEKHRRFRHRSEAPEVLRAAHRLARFMGNAFAIERRAQHRRRLRMVVAVIEYVVVSEADTEFICFGGIADQCFGRLGQRLHLRVRHRSQRNPYFGMSWRDPEGLFAKRRMGDGGEHEVTVLEASTTQSRQPGHQRRDRAHG